jgi:hypothetical protein
MQFEYRSPGSQYRHVFEFDKKWPDYVDIRTYSDYAPGATAWLHKIRDGKIIWRQDDTLHLSPDAKTYISKFVRMKAFL